MAAVAGKLFKPLAYTRAFAPVASVIVAPAIIPPLLISPLPKIDVKKSKQYFLPDVYISTKGLNFESAVLREAALVP